MTLLLALTLSAAPLAFSALPLPASAAPARHTSHHAAPAPAMQDSSEAIDLFSDTTGIDTAFDDPVFTHHADDDDDEDAEAELDLEEDAGDDSDVADFEVLDADDVDKF